ncbi:MAG: VTT domain-containing protein [Proteobacteria bacterium]|nr:VTT domain-containing protein [Pseudomonadota bacterium]
MNFFSRRNQIVIGVVFFSLALLVYIYRIPLWDQMVFYYDLFTDREKIKTFIGSFGAAAPAVFILIQILQVIFAPIPGEATGFIGGYLFGAVKGFILSTIGLTAGSWINFIIGRFLGKRYIRKIIPSDSLQKFDTVLKHQGIFVIIILFIFPGFPKDYLCLFLGISSIPVKVFLIIAALGRMPGTFMLSLQGASLYDKSYKVFALITVIFIICAIIGYVYREYLYRWIDKLNNK